MNRLLKSTLKIERFKTFMEVTIGGFILIILLVLGGIAIDGKLSFELSGTTITWVVTLVITVYMALVYSAYLFKD